jgi:hypothetical protein
MKRALFAALVLALVMAPAALAQEKQDKPANPPPAKAKRPPLDLADVETLTGRPSTQAAPSPAPAKRPPVDPADVETLTGRPSGQGAPSPAPKKGAPLDWRDVDILTGKSNARSRATATPYVYVDAPGYGRGRSGSVFTDSQFAPVTTETSPLFAPRAFGRVRDHSFVVFGNTAGSPRFFFGPRPSGRATFFFILP